MRKRRIDSSFRTRGRWIRKTIRNNPQLSREVAADIGRRSWMPKKEWT